MTSPTPCFIASTPLHPVHHRRPLRTTRPARPSRLPQPPHKPRRALPQIPVATTTGRTTSPQAAPNTPSPRRILSNLYSFSRPHTIHGTTLSVLSLTLVAYLTTPMSLAHALGTLLTTLPPALLLNVYIVGLNQLYDKSIDRVNKPYLPLPAGRMTDMDAVFVIVMCCVLGLLFCFAPFATVPLRVVLLGSVVLGTLYSMPPFRLKRFALLASISILSVRGMLINLGFFLHVVHTHPFSTTLSTPFIPPILRFATLFFTVFGVVIALLKDVPDINGDRLYGIRTFSVRLGGRVVFQACVFTIMAMFAVAGVVYMRAKVVPALVAVAHFGIAAFVKYRAGMVKDDQQQVYQFYMLVWKLFYLEYLLLPLVAL